MSISVVNGYVCFNCTDQEKAQKGIDPANPTNDPSQNPATVARKDTADAIARAAAIDTGKAGSNGNAIGSGTDVGQVGSPAALLAPGTGGLLDVTA